VTRPGGAAAGTGSLAKGSSDSGALCRASRLARRVREAAPGSAVSRLTGRVREAAPGSTVSRLTGRAKRAVSGYGEGKVSRDEEFRDTRRNGAGERRGSAENLVVPKARPDSYYGRPMIKEPVWASRDVASYLFFGGLAGASSLLAAFAQMTGNRELARASKTGAAAAIGLSVGALVADLGRPARFLNMLRVFKVTSPMSVGSWLVSGYGPASATAAVCALTGKLPRTGAVATATAAELGAGVATYTAALLADTAVPAWHDGHRELPYLFAGSAATAAGGLGMLAVGQPAAAQAIRFAVLGSAAELTAKSMLLQRLGDAAQPYQSGLAGKLMQAGEVLTAAGLAGAILAGRNRAAAAVSGTALLAASAVTRYGVFFAGRASARDPRYTAGPQRQRLQSRAGSEPSRSGAQPT
jgi:formate-dependent nitrite reductase membrane component NrfD